MLLVRIDILGNEVSENRNGKHNTICYEEMVEIRRHLDSAAGTAKTGRDEHKQAIFPLRGKPLNTYGKELADIIKNEEVQNLLKVLGCGVGEKFNINNLRYDKIILMSDADVK